MAICGSCGFDGHVEQTVCAVCGATDEETLIQTDPDQRTLVKAAPAGPAPEPARQLFRSRYRPISILGRGGMGAVHRAIDTETDRVVALKILHEPTRVEDVSFARFQREVRILRRLDHPLIPHILDAGLEDGRMFLVTDLIEGESLRTLIGREAPFEAQEISRIGAFIAEGLEIAHQNGVIHRDIKPHNIMMTPEREVRLLDFGIARDVTSGARSITESGMLVGTPEYMSPEQFQGEKVDARTDIYSLGVLLFQMSTGQLPFRAETPISLGIMHVSEPPAPPRSIVPEIPARLNRLILKCLEKRREDRYPTAGDLAAELRGVTQQRRRVSRMRSGDFLIEDEGDQQWALVIASREEKDWPDGVTLLMKGTYYRLDLREYDEEMPGPWIYRFSFGQEGEVLRKLIEYDPDERIETSKPSSFLRKFLNRD